MKHQGILEEMSEEDTAYKNISGRILLATLVAKDPDPPEGSLCKTCAGFPSPAPNNSIDSVFAQDCL